MRSMDLHCCFYSCCFADNLKLNNLRVFDSSARAAEAIRVSAAKLINSMFPLHVLFYPDCKYFSCLGTNSLEELFVEENKKMKIHKMKTSFYCFFGTSGWGSRPGWPLPVPTFVLFLPLETPELAG